MSNIDEEAKNNFTIEMRIFFYRMNARDVRSLASLCVVSWHALNMRSDFCVVVKCGWEVLAESYHEEGKSCGTKRGVRLR